MDVDAVLAAHDRQVRRDLTTAPGFRAEAVGRVVRVTAPTGSSSSFIEWSGLDAASADTEIAAQVAYFTRLGQPFEWKTYGRDGPSDLGTRLTRAGFVAEDPEAFMVGELDTVLAATASHHAVDGVELRLATRADVAGIAALSEVVWQDDSTAMLNELFTEQEHDPDALQLLVAMAGGTVVSFGWIRLPANDLQASGAVRRTPSTEAAASTAHSCVVVPSSAPRAATGTCRSTAHQQAGRSWSGSACAHWTSPRPTAGDRRPRSDVSASPSYRAQPLASTSTGRREKPRGHATGSAPTHRTAHLCAEQLGSSPPRGSTAGSVSKRPALPGNELCTSSWGGSFAGPTVRVADVEAGDDVPSLSRSRG